MLDLGEEIQSLLNRIRRYMDYEEIKDAIQDGKVENDGIWLSWEDLWRIDAVACRNAGKAMEDKDVPLFHSFIGQRMLIGDIAELIRPKEQTEE